VDKQLSEMWIDNYWCGKIVRLGRQKKDWLKQSKQRQTKEVKHNNETQYYNHDEMEHVQLFDINNLHLSSETPMVQFILSFNKQQQQQQQRRAKQ
jgi:hypothetical protein